MRLFLHQVLAIFRKDLVSELREPHHFFSVILFGPLLLLLFSFALSIDPDLMRQIAAGLFWMSLLFTTLLTLDHSFRKETDDGQWEGLLLLGIDAKALYLGKFLSHFTFIILLQILLLPLMAILFDLHLTCSLFAVLILGSLGITSLGTLYAGLTATFRERQALLPLLLFPMLVPVLLASVKVTELILAQDLFGQQVAWMKLLIVFDVVFVFGSLVAAEILFDEY